MTKALISLLQNRAVRTMITELCVGVAVGVVAVLTKRDSNAKSKRFLLHMQERPSDHRGDGPEKEVRAEDSGNKISEKRQSWDRERSYSRDYM